MRKHILLAFLISTISTIANAQFSNTERQELGDVNLIENAGGENGLQRWTNSGGTFATESGANVAVGSRSFSWDASAASDTLTSKQQSIPVGLRNRFCYASFLYKGGDSNITAEIIDGSLTVLASKALTAQTDYSLAELSFTCPSSGTVAFRLSAGADAAILYLDQVFVGIRAANVTHSVSPTVYELSKQSIGTVGAVDNTQQAVSLTDISAADSNVAGFSLSGGVTKTFGTATATLTNNAVAAFDSEGFYGRGDVARFDGSSNAISSTDAHFLSTGKDWSFSMWVAADAWEPSGGQLLMGNGGGTNGTRGTDILLNGPGSAGIQLRVSDDGGASASDQLSVDASSFKSGSWHHIAGTYDFSATTLKFYIDGVLVDSSSSVTDTNTESTFYLGDENASGAAFNGSIQDFIWIDGDLYSDAEVNAIYSRRFEGPQIKAGHVLDSDSFNSAIADTKLSFWNLNDVNDDSTNSRTLTDEGGMAFTGADILGGSTAAVFDGTAAGTLAYTADDFFNKGRADFTMGVWVSLNDWDKSGTDEVLFGTSPSGGDRVIELIMKTNDFTLRPVITTLTTTDTIDFVPNPEPINGSWHHIVLVYDSTPNEMRLYWDGYFGASVTLGDDLKVGGSNEFNLGTFRNQDSAFMSGKMQEFFWSQTVMSDDDIRKIYSAKLTHNQSVGIGDQQWYGNFFKGDNSTIVNELDQDWLLDKKSNFLFIETGLEPEDSLSLRLQNQSFSATSIPIKTFTTGILEAAPSFPINTGLPCSPQDFYVRTEGQSLSGQWDKRFDLLSVTDSGTLNGDVSSLTIDASHRLEIVAGCVAPAMSFNLDNFDLLITKDISSGDLFVPTGKTLFRPNLEIASGDTFTINGTFNTVGEVIGAGTLAGTGTVSSIDEQQVYGLDKTFQGDVTIGGTLFGGSPLDIGSLLNLIDEGGTDTEAMRFTRKLDSDDYVSVMSRQVPSEGLALDFEMNFFNGASRETRRGLQLLPSGMVNFVNGTTNTKTILDSSVNSSSGTVNNLSIGDRTFVDLTNSSALTIQNIEAGAGVRGQLLIFLCRGAGTVSFVNQNSTGGGQQFYTNGNGNQSCDATGGSTMWLFDGTLWRLISNIP